MHLRNERNVMPDTNGYILITFPYDDSDPDMTVNLDNVNPGHVLQTFTICLGLLLTQAPKEQRWKVRRTALKMARINTKRVLSLAEDIEG